MRKSGHSSAAAPLPEPADERSSERRIAICPAPGEPSEEALKRAVIAYARSQQPPPATRERILAAVLAELGVRH